MDRLAPPNEIEGLPVSPAEDPILFWTCGSNRRIVVADWGELKILGRRVFRRYRGGQGHWNNLQAMLHKLEVPGMPAAAVFNGHVVGYIRPWTLNGQEIAVDSKPAMIAKASRRGFYLINPVLVASIEHGRELLRRLRDQRGASPVEWQCYHGEAPGQVVEKLFMNDSQGIRTELEHQLTQSFGPAGRARQAFTRPDALLAS